MSFSCKFCFKVFQFSSDPKERDTTLYDCCLSGF
ncbi:hypothetical protein AALP_AA3G273500 [Arabis alpina]|uniref:Uncharacterized protein n=1 Tax=Arabis alpina TaxID=50452 RepID=A0A087HC14_ARAAL|nr:hypothetical protein AALP_AA3G273500 [Arabis alpina]